MWERLGEVRRGSAREPTHQVVGKLPAQVLGVEGALGPVPSGDPVDASQDGEHSNLGVHVPELSAPDPAGDDYVIIEANERPGLANP